MPEWTPELESDLRRLWADGRTCSDIGQTLGGFSKSSITGKARRLKLSSRPSPVGQGSVYYNKHRITHGRRVAKSSNPKLHRLPPERQSDGHAWSGPISDSSCQWPIGVPREPEFHFCGAPALIGKPYCGEHCGIGLIRVKPYRAPAPNTDAGD